MVMTMKELICKVDEYGNKCWYNENEQRHRKDGPAIEWASGTKSWLINGTFHREDGPAIEYSDGSKEWLINGKFHREDGPAIEYNDGTKYWYINDEVIETEEEYWRLINLKLLW